MSPMTPTPLTIEWGLLGFLHQASTHGYELYQRLCSSHGLGIVWNLKQSQLYAMLARLEERGYIEATLEAQDSYPPRKVYALTPAAEEGLRTWIESPVEHGRDFRTHFLAKLYFARREGQDVAQRLLARQQERCRDWLAAREEEAEAVREARPYEWLVYQFRIGQIRAMLAWLELCEETLVKGEG